MFKRSTLLSLSVSIALATTTLSPSLSVAGDAPTYKPLVAGAPDTRVGGGSRGSRGSRGLDNSIPSLMVLAPKHTGYTLKEQPSLYWTGNNINDKPVKFTMVYTDYTKGIEPLIETEIKPVKSEAIQSIDLAALDWKIKEKALKPGVEYQWSVSMTMGAEQSSQDIVSSGTITLVNPSELTEEAKARIISAQEKIAQIKGQKDEQLAFIYADAGLFYDALESISTLISKNDQDSELKQQRSALLEQVGLVGITEEDSSS